MSVHFRRRFLATLVAGAAGLYAAGSLAAVSPLELVAPIADYKIYVAENVRKLATDTRAFTAAVKAGDIEKAKKLYAPTRTSYEKIEPIAELFSDLDSAIDSRADDHEKAEKDPAFGGFHRIEYALWTQKSTQGVGKTADKLLADVLELQKRLGALTFPPEKVVGGAAVLMEEVAATKISGEENRYSHTDLWDFEANFEGSKSAIAALRPFLLAQDPALVAKIDTTGKALGDLLETYRDRDGFVLYPALTPADIKKLTEALDAFSEPVATVAGAVAQG